jgi:outer membrane lipoprotein LolB
LAATLLLGGCASLPFPPQGGVEEHARHLQQLAAIDSFGLTGRIGLQTEQKGFSGKLRWQHAPSSDVLAFYSPLGSQVAQIVASPDGVTLTTSDRKTYTAEDAETLLSQTMGWSLPLHGLTDWVLGRPAPRMYMDVRWDERGRLTHLVQDGWNIEFPAYQNVGGTELPSKVILKSLKLDLKLLVEQWQTGEAQP